MRSIILWVAMSDNGYFKILHKLIRSDELMEAPLQYRWVLLVLLDRVVHFPCTQNDHGTLVDLFPGQVIVTSRKLAEWAKVTPSCAYRAMLYFEKVQILTQEVKHTKTIVTILWGMKLESSETEIETKVKQDRNTKEDIQNKVVVVVDYAHARKQAIPCKAWLDKHSQVTRKRKVGRENQEITWGRDWILPIELFESLISKYGYKYFEDQMNYMVKLQIEFDQGKRKKNIDNPNSFLRKACQENWALSKSEEKLTSI